MKNKFTLLMLLMVMFGSSLFSQTASLPTGTASPGEQISVPLSVTGFTKIGSIMFKIQIDPTILTYTGLTGEPAGMVGNVSGTTLTLTWNVTPPVDFPDGVLLHIDFDYNGPGTSTMNFLPSSEIIRNNPPGNYTVLSVAYTNGLVTPYLLNTAKATILGQTCVTTGATVSFPIKYEGFGSTVGAITQKIQYDAAKLTFSHPTTAKQMEFAAPVPDDMQSLIEAARADKGETNGKRVRKT